MTESGPKQTPKLVLQWKRGLDQRPDVYLLADDLEFEKLKEIVDRS